MIQLVAPRGYWYKKDSVKFGNITRPAWFRSITITEGEKDQWHLVTDEEYATERQQLDIKLPPMIQNMLDKYHQILKPKTEE